MSDPAEIDRLGGAEPAEWKSEGARFGWVHSQPLADLLWLAVTPPICLVVHDSAPKDMAVLLLEAGGQVPQPARPYRSRAWKGCG